LFIGRTFMVYGIELTEEAPQSVAATKIHTTLQRIGGDIGTGFGSLMQALARENISPSGPPLIVYHDVINTDTDGEIEICVPIDTPIDGDSSVYGRELEGGTMAVTIHHGPYEEIAPAYQTLTEWIAERGHEIAGPPREIYLNDPQTVPPAELLTRIEFPLCTEAG